MEQHLKYFHLNLKSLPYHYTGSEASRMTLVYFCISALDLLDDLDPLVDEQRNWIEWIYAQQVVSKNNWAGFRGGPCLGDGSKEGIISNEYDAPHLAMTYSAILSLLILGDDLNRLQNFDILKYLTICQQADGSFAPYAGSKECDMRFVFCAFSICFLLKDWSSINVSKSLDFIQRSQTYDGGFGTGPERESHGGSTYCAIASLIIADKISIIDQPLLLKWLIHRQDRGFHGRTNKPDDTCYGYWIGCCIEMMGFKDLVDTTALEQFLETTKSKYGGFGKAADSFPDIFAPFLESRKNMFLNTFKCKLINNSILLKHRIPKNIPVRSFSCVPSDILGDVLQSIHSHASLPWGYTIIASTLLFRIGITLPLAVLQRRNQQRLNLMQPLSKAWANTISKYASADSKLSENDSQSKSLSIQSFHSSKRAINKRFRARISFIHQQVNCHPVKEIILPIIQIPFFISMTAAIRELIGTPFLWISASEPTVGMSTEGFAWFSNLLESDPSLITPILCGLFHFINGEIIIKERLANLKNSRPLGIMKGFHRLLALLMAAIASQAPMAIVLYWTTSAAFSSTQNILLNWIFHSSPKVR